MHCVVAINKREPPGEIYVSMPAVLSPDNEVTFRVSDLETLVRELTWVLRRQQSVTGAVIVTIEENGDIALIRTSRQMTESGIQVAGVVKLLAGTTRKSFDCLLYEDLIRCDATVLLQHINLLCVAANDGGSLAFFADPKLVDPAVPLREEQER